ncbi:hypothetical protein, partial [Frankia sp. EI5c]|uniref:hypothetical protein n=1 Tax=Frankia sp. EI5c TaxID=683316 RepID=UPI001A7EBB13
ECGAPGGQFSRQFSPKTRQRRPAAVAGVAGRVVRTTATAVKQCSPGPGSMRRDVCPGARGRPVPLPST